MKKKYLLVALVLLALCGAQVATTNATILFPSGGGTGTSTTPFKGGIATGNGSTLCYTATSTDGFVLSASSTAPCGVAWIAAAAGGGSTTSTIAVGGTTVTGPSFTFATSSPVTISASGTTMTWGWTNPGFASSSITISGGGIISGGGDLTANRTLTLSTTTLYSQFSGTSPISFSTSTGAISCPTCSTAVGANPTAQVGTAAVNGSSANFMRADGAPALNQAATFSFSALGNTTSTGSIAASSITASTTLTVTGTSTLNGTLDANVNNALLLGGSTGIVSGYGGASACAAGNAVTTISAVGATTCAVFLNAIGTSGSDVNISGSTLNIPDAGAAARGVVNTTTQTFAGAKTFSGAFTLQNSVTQSGGLASFASTTINGSATTTGAAVFQSTITETNGGITQSGGANSIASTTINGSATTTGGLVVQGTLKLPSILNSLLGTDASGNVIATTTSSGSAAVGAFGGTGTDGALNQTSTNLSINLGGLQVFTKNYTSINITGTGSVSFTNPSTNGTIIVFKSQGACNVSSTAARAIDLRLLGGLGGTGGGAVGAGVGDGGGGGGSATGAGATANGGAGGAQTAGIIGGGFGSMPYFGFQVGGQGGSNVASELGGFSTAYVINPTSTVNFWKYYVIPGSGGGGGGGTVTGAGTNGGTGGGALYFECAGAFNFPVGSTIDASGQTATSTSNAQGPGGSAGGGSVEALATSITASTGTCTVTGGAQTAGFNVNLFGGAGAPGYCAFVANTDFGGGGTTLSGTTGYYPFYSSGSALSSTSSISKVGTSNVGIGTTVDSGNILNVSGNANISGIGTTTKSMVTVGDASGTLALSPLSWEYLGSCTITGSPAASCANLTVAAKDMLMIIVRVTGYGGADIASLRFNADTGNNYNSRYLASGATGVATLTNNQTLTTNFGRLFAVTQTTGRSAEIICSNNSGTEKLCTVNGISGVGSVGTVLNLSWGGFSWVNTAAQITSVQLITAGAQTLNVGSAVMVYGRNFN